MQCVSNNNALTDNIVYRRQKDSNKNALFQVDVKVFSTQRANHWSRHGTPGQASVDLEQLDVGDCQGSNMEHQTRPRRLLHIVLFDSCTCGSMNGIFRSNGYFKCRIESACTRRSMRHFEYYKVGQIFRLTPQKSHLQKLSRLPFHTLF